jgi:hypothetical protein
MKIRRGIFGGALLFAAAGCTEAQTTNPADTVATEVAGDSTAGDVVAVDTTAQDVAAQDTAGVDTELAPTDTGVSDANDDTSVSDAASTDTQTPMDTAEADAAEDDATIEDTHASDAMADVALPPKDVGDDDTSGCKLLTVANAEGEKCDEQMGAICDPENPQDVALMCHDAVWKKMADLEQQFPVGCFCEPGQDECSYAFAACAVPGFVGLDSADRVRTAARRLRLV